MDPKKKTFLVIDGMVNLVLGILLLLFPLGMAEILGLPIPENNFYPTILGGVIFGIGVALLIERHGFEKKIRGLGLGGAIIINLCGSLVLLGWLIFAQPAIPLRGAMLLWTIGILVLAIGIIELTAKSWKFD